MMTACSAALNRSSALPAFRYDVRFDRHQLARIAEIAIAMLDELDGDEDLEDNGDAELDDPDEDDDPLENDDAC